MLAGYDASMMVSFSVMSATRSAQLPLSLSLPSPARSVIGVSCSASGFHLSTVLSDRRKNVRIPCHSHAYCRSEGEFMCVRAVLCRRCRRNTKVHICMCVLGCRCDVANQIAIGRMEKNMNDKIRFFIGRGGGGLFGKYCCTFTSCHKLLFLPCDFLFCRPFGPFGISFGS